MSRHKPLVGSGLLAKCECFLKRERLRQLVAKRGRKRIRHGGVEIGQIGAQRMHTHGPRDAAAFAENCNRLVAYLLRVHTADTGECACAMGMTRGKWLNFLDEASFVLPIYEDDCGMIGLCRWYGTHLTKQSGVR